MIPPENGGKDLLPSKEKQIIELLRLPGKLQEYSYDEQVKLLQSLSILLEISEVKLTRAVAGSIRMYLELSPEDADKIYSANKEGQLAELGISGARLYPTIALPPDQEQRKQLLILLNRVKEYWVDGVLKHSLHNEVLISLGKRTMDEAVEAPWKYTVEVPNQRRHLLLKDRNIKTVFEATGLLLILGEPGSGKTTTLLEIASDLIVRARTDPKERVPIVLNLSSWKKKQVLVDWMASELSAKYRVPFKIAKSWLTSDYLVPLLDGLDEVQTALQPDCVAAINDFIDQIQPAGLVVCCRLMEYQWLPERLKLNGAICLESLTSEEVNEFLAAGGPQLAGLHQALNNDSVLQELSRSPLMLSIMCLAYEGTEGEELSRQQTDSTELRRKQIFSRYIERMFERKPYITSPFSKDTIIGWLSWLAKKMKEHSQSVFMVEGLQPSWLSSPGQRRGYKAVLALSVAPIGGLICGLSSMQGGNDLILSLLFGLGSCPIFGLGILLGCRSESPLKNGVMSGLIVGLIGGLTFGLVFGLIGGLAIQLILWLIIGLLGGLIAALGIGSANEINLVETMRWQSNQFWKKTIPGLIIGLVFALSAELIMVLSMVGILAWWSKLLLALLGSAIIGGAISGLLGGMTDTVRADKASPNQGIRLSLKNGLFALSIVGVALSIVALLFGLLGWIPMGLISMLIYGLFFGLLGGLNRGGSAVLKHYALRLILWIKGYTPFRFIKFLDLCAKLILLKKVGGGYMFIHRTLLEYFAELNPQSNKA